MTHEEAIARIVAERQAKRDLLTPTQEKLVLDDVLTELYLTYAKQAEADMAKGVQLTTFRTGLLITAIRHLAGSLPTERED